MKQLTYILFFFLIATFANAQTTEKKFDLSNFTKVNIGNDFAIEIKQAAQYSVVANGDANELEKIIGSVTNNTLELGYKSNKNILKSTIKVLITMPTFKDLTLSGATSTKLIGFSDLENIILELSGTAKLVGSIQAKSIVSDISGASRMELDGKAETLTLEASGASKLQANNFKVETITIKVSGASSATIHPTKHLDAEASGASKIRYKNIKSVNSKSSGASSIKPE